MTLIDGKKFSDNIKENLKNQCEDLKKQGIHPGLAVVLVGDDPASATYVNMKDKACQRIGIHSKKIHLPAQTNEEKLLKIIDELNDDDKIHGILVQLPLPKHFDTNKILEAINPQKDVDGFHAINVGHLNQDRDSFVACTPLGIMKLLEHYNINVTGLHACVIGASNIVGKPMINLLLNKRATVTCTHSKTKNLEFFTKNADLIIVGVGKPNLLKANMVKQGAIVVDVGINRLESGSLVGDVDFEEVSKKCSLITPVPGGVGPMTIAMLLSNTIKSAKKAK
ncbi:MAG: bifunctional methylenetetrahydrofolate dehydrogenase/methenyltetrahydrofolate cyclohydrolase FolD [Proteobacteria bacterium]|nr:MAG: bifunctional methylenetetrahydrofolate dehydrogenase/methenyltetrahydrofolate cyclohydrolase FolD [Pseudomonadota bacterium]